LIYFLTKEEKSQPEKPRLIPTTHQPLHQKSHGARRVKRGIALQ
jgi:hypothetical protein